MENIKTTSILNIDSDSFYSTAIKHMEDMKEGRSDKAKQIIDKKIKVLKDNKTINK